ncbi:unnamed protein product, partial [Didymodactylos carnosus]
LFTSTEIIEEIQRGQISLNEIKKKYSDLLKNAYYYELESFEVPPEQLELCEEQTPESLQDTKYEYVDTGEKLKNMADHIQLQSEIAVDLSSSISIVLHSSENDIEWLQKDFGVYMVNMFDTFCAAEELYLSGLSLACLLKEFGGVDTNKDKYQNEDWRKLPVTLSTLVLN